MKMTMHIDGDVLDRVMKITGAKTKTEAVEIALNEMARRHKMKELFTAGLGLTPEELKASFDPASYPEEPQPMMLAAKEQAPNGQPDPAR
ncbi:MAG: type II toxin-antitoxin system VapB family antitoxin [Undibacterium sp.]|nr:type II toxin-antitoxin system VapB family antitoxin [Opitutaceae bacterium]